MLNVDSKKFKLLHKKKQNQIIFTSITTSGEKEILNLIDNFLIDKNSFVFESVEKVQLKADILFLVKILIKFGNLITIIVINIMIKKLKLKLMAGQKELLKK